MSDLLRAQASRWMRLLGVVAVLAVASHSIQAQESTVPDPLMTLEPFAVAVPDKVLDDLRARLRATRFAPQVAGAGHAAGFDTAALREVVVARKAFDQRAAEGRPNAVPQFTVANDGQIIHFAHVESAHEDAVPLLLLHG